MKKELFLIITVIFTAYSISNAQTENSSNIELTLIKTIDISQKLSPDGYGIGRPDVVAIGDTLYLAYGIITKRNFHLIKLKADLNLTTVEDTTKELFSGCHDFSIDIRVSKANNNFWYAFEDNKYNGEVGNTHFLNAAWYSSTDSLIGKQTDIATGILTTIPEAFNVNPNDVPPDPEAVDDPTPFYYNGKYYIFTRAWSGWIEEFTPNANHHIRIFNEKYEKIDDFILDLSPVIPDRTLSQNTLVDIDGQVFLIGGFYIARNAASEGSYIYAIPLSTDLKYTVGESVSLLGESDNWMFKVTAARVYKGYLFINYQEYLNNQSIQKAAIFDINNNFDLIESVEISKCPIGDGGILANHTTLEIVNDKLFVFYPETEFRIFAKIYEITTLNSVDDTDGIIPSGIQLNQNYPNPFNPTTVISYQLPICSKATLKIYDVLGQEVRTLVNENKSAGSHSVVWNGTDNSGRQVSSGVYFYSLELDNLSACGRAQADNYSQKKKLLLLK